LRKGLFYFILQNLLLPPPSKIYFKNVVVIQNYGNKNNKNTITNDYLINNTLLKIQCSHLFLIIFPIKEFNDSFYETILRVEVP